MKTHKISFCKKLFCLGLIFTMLFCSSTSVLALEPEVNYDEFLISKGMPQSVINQLPEKQKELIYSTVGENATYSSFDREVILDNNYNGSDASTYGTIPSYAMTFTVVGFEDYDNYYAIYPSFVWNTTAKVANDAFVMALYPGWEVVPGDTEHNLAVWTRDEYDDLIGDVDIEATASSAYGFGYVIPKSVYKVTGDYEGHSYIHAIKTNSNATHGISLCYADDTSTNFTAVYGISITAGSAGISSTSSSVNYRSALLSF